MGFGEPTLEGASDWIGLDWVYFLDIRFEASNFGLELRFGFDGMVNSTQSSVLPS